MTLGVEVVPLRTTELNDILVPSPCPNPPLYLGVTPLRPRLLTDRKTTATGPLVTSSSAPEALYDSVPTPVLYASLPSVRVVQSPLCPSGRDGFGPESNKHLTLELKVLVFSKKGSRFS